MANTKFKMILRMLFLKLSNTNMLFGKITFIWRSYITNKALPTTKQVQIINLKEFVIVILNANNETFVVHMAI